MTTPARRLALDVLEIVLSKRRFLDDAIADQSDAFLALSVKDRAFVRALLLTTFRRLGEIDEALAGKLARPLPSTANSVRAILRLGVSELLFMRAPAYATVDAAVEAAKERAVPFAKLVNAVLRRVAREEAGRTNATQDAISEDDARRNTPAWLWRLLSDDWGDERAVSIARGQLRPAPLDLTPRDANGGAEIAASLGGSLTSTGSVRITNAGDPTALPGYDDGAWWVQDAAATLPAQMLDVRRGERVLDLCAAPGGKTLQLAAAGADVTAVDISEWRLRRLSANLTRTGLTAETLRADALTWRPATPFDAVLLDAPCSATGTIRRHPEALHIKSNAGLPQLTDLQDRLLDAAWEMISPGGRLVFCTCSLLKIEGEDRADAFAKRHPDAQRHDEVFRTPIFQTFSTVNGALRTTPADWAVRGGVDGFFAARFDRAI